MLRKGPSKQAEIQYTQLSKNFFVILSIAGVIALLHLLFIRPFFPGIVPELVTGAVMIGVAIIGTPIAFVKANRDARRLCPIEATAQPQQNPQS